MKRELTRRIESKEAVIGIIGMGYVGLPLALRFAEAGFRVTGFDVDRAKAESIADRHSYFAHIADSRISAAVSGALIAKNARWYSCMCGCCASCTASRSFQPLAVAFSRKAR